jgi:trans-aconitate 2-methyltransferase
MPSWNADQYLQFADERTRPCRDLIARIALEQPARIIDLGCGPGNSTEVLAQRWPEAEITGLDSSPAMLAAAQKSHPEIDWITGDIAGWTAAAPCDLVFSNAAVHWVPDHSTILPRLLSQLAPEGALAFQVPANFDAPAHRAMRELASSRAWKSHFPGTVREWHVHEPAFYYDLLAPQVARLDLWTTEYFHIMESSEAIVEWYKGTGLRPYLDLLPAADQGRFLLEYRRLIHEAFPPHPDGHVIFPFLRLFLIAYL